MISALIKHTPILQVLLPLFAACFCVLNKDTKIPRIIAIASLLICYTLTIANFPNLNDSILYAIGDWQAPIGIEYRLDRINQPALLYIHGAMLYFLVFCHSQTQNTILNYIEPSRASLFYAILLFAHSGYVGMISTNDLFNLYVFIEISSLSSYVLMAQGNNPKASIGAFDYLMLGTIGATLMLIGIGFLFSATGSLNISDIQIRLAGLYEQRVVLTGISFFLTGAILKLAFFPMHFWMLRAYTSAPTIILCYLAAISGVIGTYVIVRFLQGCVDYDTIVPKLALMVRPIALITIIVCSWLAFRSNNLKKIIIYSSTTQIGTCLLLVLIKSSSFIFPILLLIDGVNKIALFSLISLVENINEGCLDLDKIKHIDRKNYLFRIIIAMILLSSAGLPLTAMFITKLNILHLIFAQRLFVDFAVIVAGSVISLLYHYKIAKALLFSGSSQSTSAAFKNYGLIVLVLFQFLILIMM